MNARSRSIRQTHRRRPGQARRGGFIFVIALGIIVILVSLVLVFARNMRAEAMAAASRESYVQADAIEQGAEQWVLATIESTPGDAVTITQTPAEAIQLGNGYFWLVRPSQQSDQDYDFGIIDEAGKLNINTATSDQLMNLPDMTQDIADAIYDWRSTAGAAAGGESNYYQSLPDPYTEKNAPFETVEELNLVEGITPQLLFGYDTNRNGMIDASEQAAEGSSSILSGVNDDSLGIFNDLTCYSVDPNTTAAGGARVNVNSANTTRLLNTLTSALGSSRGGQIFANLIPFYARTTGRAAFSNIGAFFIDSGMTAAEFGKVADQLTTSTSRQIQGLINVNTASAAVLACLPGLQQSDAQSLVNARSTADLSSIAWVFPILSNSKAQLVAGAITSRSFIYSADIVAVSGDGRSYKRVRIVVDDRQAPAKIIYRRDLSSYGWPLPPEIRTAMRAGQAPPVGYASSGNGQIGLGM
jgi:DNA uptake protein ComE-like DNA-binding protein